MRDSGLLKYAFVYDQRNLPPWPTLRELIESDRRLVMFVENGRGGTADWDPVVRALWVCAFYVAIPLFAGYLVFLRRDVAGE